METEHFTSIWTHIYKPHAWESLTQSNSNSIPTPDTLESGIFNMILSLITMILPHLSYSLSNPKDNSSSNNSHRSNNNNSNNHNNWNNTSHNPSDLAKEFKLFLNQWSENPLLLKGNLEYRTMIPRLRDFCDRGLRYQHVTLGEATVWLHHISSIVQCLDIEVMNRMSIMNEIEKWKQILTQFSLNSKKKKRGFDKINIQIKRVTKNDFLKVREYFSSMITPKRKIQLSY